MFEISMTVGSKLADGWFFFLKDAPAICVEIRFEIPAGSQLLVACF